MARLCGGNSLDVEQSSGAALAFMTLSVAASEHMAELGNSQIQPGICKSQPRETRAVHIPETHPETRAVHIPRADRVIPQA